MEHMCWGSWPLRRRSEELQSGSRGRNEKPGHRPAVGLHGAKSRHRCRAMMVVRFSFRNPELLPSLCVAISGVLWGLFWLPLRLIRRSWLQRRMARPCHPLRLPGFTTAIPASTLASDQAQGCNNCRDGFFYRYGFCALCDLFLMMTGVVRTLLLFYPTPVWSTLLWLLLLGERVTFGRVAALALGFMGLLVVLGLGENFNRRVLKQPDGPIGPEHCGCQPQRIPEISRPGSTPKQNGTPPERRHRQPRRRKPVHTRQLSEARNALPWLLLSGLYTLTMLYLTIGPARMISPARAGILLMGEVVVGVNSAAVLSGEPFGLR